jgi:hypothetical protein
MFSLVEKFSLTTKARSSESSENLLSALVVTFLVILYFAPLAFFAANRPNPNSFSM